jgi:hypothetical protein
MCYINSPKCGLIWSIHYRNDEILLTVSDGPKIPQRKWTIPSKTDRHRFVKSDAFTRRLGIFLALNSRPRTTQSRNRPKWCHTEKYRISPTIVRKRITVIEVIYWDLNQQVIKWSIKICHSIKIESIGHLTLSWTSLNISRSLSHQKCDIMTLNKHHLIWFVMLCDLSICNDKHCRWSEIHQQAELDLQISRNSFTSVFQYVGHRLKTIERHVSRVAVSV